MGFDFSEISKGFNFLTDWGRNKFNLKDFNHYKFFVDFYGYTGDKIDDSDSNLINAGEEFLKEDTMYQLPVNPEKVGLSNEALNETTTLLQLGEVNLIKGVKLRTVSIESFFPDNYKTMWITNLLRDSNQIINIIESSGETNPAKKVSQNIEQALPAMQLIEGLYNLNKVPPYVSTKILNTSPQEFRYLFETAMEEGRIVKLTITGANISFFATIERFEWDVRGGDPDIWYTVEFKEYKEFAYTKKNVEKDYSKDDKVAVKDPKTKKTKTGKITKTDKKKKEYQVKTAKSKDKKYYGDFGKIEVIEYYDTPNNRIIRERTPKLPTNKPVKVTKNFIKWKVDTGKRRRK